MSAIPDGSAMPSFPPSLLAGLQAAVNGSGGGANVSNGGDAPLLVLEPKNITESASDEHPGLVPLVPGTEAPLRNEAIFAFDLNQLPVKPWHEGTDPEQFFNYGFNEDTWKEHCLSTPVGEAAQLKREEKAKERDMSKMRAAAAPIPAPMPLGMFAPSGSAPAVNVELLKQVVNNLPGAAGGGGGPGGLPPPPIAPLGAPGMHGPGGGGSGSGNSGGFQPYPSPYNKGGKGGKGGGFGRKGDKGGGGFKGAGSKGGGAPEPSGSGGDGAMPPLGGGPVPLLNPALLAALSSNPALKALMGKQGAGQGGQQQQGPVAD